MKKNILRKFIFPLLLIQSSIFAQLPDSTGGPDSFGHRYTTSHAPGYTVDFVWEDASTGSVVQINDDDWINGLSIGFTFNYYGTNYTTFSVSSEGFIGFSNLADDYEGIDTDGLGNTNLPNNIVAVAWDSLVLRAFADPSLDRKVYYRTTGTAPYRKLIVEWLAVRYNNETTSGNQDDFTFEIILNSSKL